MSTTDQQPAYGIRSLFHRKWLGATLLLGAGVGLEALEFYVTASLMPSMVRDIGGLGLLAWTTSLFVAALVLGGVAIVIRPAGVTLRQVYVIGTLIFALGCLIVGLAPSMVVVLIGRFVQGFGAGLLVTLAYSFIRFVYPEGMQNAASAFYSALWGVSTLLGPTLGGWFAHDSAWRWAFFILIPLAVLMALLAPYFLPPGEDEREKQALPGIQILLILAGILTMSYAGNVEGTVMRIALVMGGIASLVALVLCERRSESRLLPRLATVFTHPLAQAYLAMFLLIIGLNSDIYIPYFLQTMHATPPLVAGYIVALVATGWAVAGMWTASWQGERARRAILFGPIVLFASMTCLAFAISRDNPHADIGILTAVCILLFGMGVGIGLGWAHLVSMVMTLSEGPEADKATAAINLVPSLAAAFGSAIAGVIANSAGLVTPGGIEGGMTAAFWLYALTSISGVLALLTVVPLLRRKTS
ncbi:MFS transporter [Rhizobium sp. KVB221]|uniref:MFS transporter n=1 Tax=Rhizobium setariae TaxID=2801340 RepID=A0A937CQI4_9HYPH|nr:MFS transporter [Rhizobium setariae]MBL0373057.1 MFS transporter [Rhizobium setariae]